MTTWAPTLAWCALVVVFAALANVWNGHEPGWYASLARPSFQPPDIVFGLMWPLNFLLLLVVGLTTVRTAPAGAAWTATACSRCRWLWRSGGPTCSTSRTASSRPLPAWLVPPC